MKILTITDRLTNCYLLPIDGGWVMFDAGWPDTLPEMLRLLQRHNVYINDIDYLIVSHFHPDHAGLAQNIKDFGTKLILHECQVPFVKKLNQYYKKRPEAGFRDIETANCIIMNSADSRNFFDDIGIGGELIQTPGHSDDSISLIVDDACAFIGDLPDPDLAEAYDDPQIEDSWDLIRSHPVKTIYPAHGKPYELS